MGEELFAALKIAGVIKGTIDKQVNNKKIDEVIEKLNHLSLTCNELILREIRASYKALDDCISCNNDNIDKEQFSKIEAGLFKNTGLNSGLTTGMIKNSDIIALSYYGLSFLKIQQNDYNLSYRYILRMFESGSRLSRTTLASDFYDIYFRPYCDDCYAKYEKKLNNIPDIFDYSVKASVGLYSAIISVGAPILGFTVGAIFRSVPTITKAVNEAEKHSESVFENTLKDKAWFKNTRKIKEELEDDLDKKCAELAVEKLNEGQKKVRI